MSTSSVDAVSVQLDEQATYIEALYVVPEDPASSRREFRVTVGQGASRREAQFRALCSLWDKAKAREPFWLSSLVDDL